MRFCPFKLCILMSCRAIAQAVICSLTLWQGPPGTGKTRTLLALVEVLVKTALKKSSRWKAMGPLLACADTNAAVDNLVEGLLDKGLKVVRLGQPAKVCEELRSAGFLRSHHKHGVLTATIQLLQIQPGVRRSGQLLASTKPCCKQQWLCMT